MENKCGNAVLESIIDSNGNEIAQLAVLNTIKGLEEHEQVKLLMALSKRLNAHILLTKQINTRELIKLKVWFFKTVVIFGTIGFISTAIFITNTITSDDIQSIIKAVMTFMTALAIAVKGG